MKNISIVILAILNSILFMPRQEAKSQTNIIPLPVNIENKTGYFTINKNTCVYIEKGFDLDANFVYEKLKEATGLPLKRTYKVKSNSIILSNKCKKKNLGVEGYELDVTNLNISLNANSPGGLYYALQTLLQLLPPEVYSTEPDLKNNSFKVSALSIYDYPRFEWRGMMLDVSRQFFDADYIKKYIDWLSAHKINVFHWHLTDDEGWRIEIKKYPLLTQKGAWRGKNEILPPAWGSGDNTYGGYYTQEQIREIVKYAQQRNVSILPEIDMPGHSRALTACYPEVLCHSTDTTSSVQGVRKNVWCAGKESNFQMIEDILGELTALFPFEYIHIGGDEVNKKSWEHCELCKGIIKDCNLNNINEVQSYFIMRLEKTVTGLGKKMIGWNEIAEGGKLNQNSYVMAWQSEKHGYEAALKGYSTIMVPGSYLYFDMAQSGEEQGHSWAGMVSIERTYSFDPINNDSLPKAALNKIKGVQAALWSEFLDKPNGIADYQSYPRICALAEIAWTPQENRNWANFYTRLQSEHYNRLYNMGIKFRLPPPDAVYKNHIITVTNPGLNLITRFTNNGHEPDLNSTIYSSTITTSSPYNYKFKTFFKDHSSISMPVFPYSELKWTPENTPVRFGEINFDISQYITKNGRVEVKFRFKKGKNGLLVKKVSLQENGKIIDFDHHDGTIAAGRTSNNVYKLNIDSYNENNIYKIIIELQGRWGTNSYGDILVYEAD